MPIPEEEEEEEEQEGVLPNRSMMLYCYHSITQGKPPCTRTSTAELAEPKGSPPADLSSHQAVVFLIPTATLLACSGSIYRPLTVSLCPLIVVVLSSSPVD